MAVGANLQFQSKLAGGGVQASLHTPFAWLDDDELLRGHPAGRREQFLGERARAGCVVQRPVMHSETTFTQTIPEVAHGCEEQRNARLMRPDVG